MKPGLTPSDDYPYPGAYLRPVARLSGGGGLVSSLPGEPRAQPTRATLTSRSFRVK
jgi:hypothetical protein